MQLDTEDAALVFVHRPG